MTQEREINRSTTEVLEAHTRKGVRIRGFDSFEDASVWSAGDGARLHPEHELVVTRVTVTTTRKVLFTHTQEQAA